MDVGSLFNILIVDDDVTDLDALYNILKEEYTLYIAKSGQAALKKVAENKPDIILLDVMMPDMDGFEVLSELKKSQETLNTPVIFITGLNAVKDEEKGLLLGAVDYITKPFHSSIVKARIKTHLEIAERLRKKDDASIMIKSRQEIRKVMFRELLYVEVSGHWLNFCLYGGNLVEVYSSLKDYEDILLADSRFARCHKSFIVNMDFIETIEVRDVLMKNNLRLPISKKYIDFKKRYVEWVRG